MDPISSAVLLGAASRRKAFSIIGAKSTGNSYYVGNEVSVSPSQIRVEYIGSPQNKYAFYITDAVGLVHVYYCSTTYGQIDLAQMSYLGVVTLSNFGSNVRGGYITPYDKRVIVSCGSPVSEIRGFYDSGHTLGDDWVGDTLTYGGSEKITTPVVPDSLWFHTASPGLGGDGSRYVYTTNNVSSSGRVYAYRDQYNSSSSLSGFTGNGYINIGAVTGDYLTDVCVNYTGKLMWVMGYGNRRIYEFDLTTPHDISTWAYRGVNLDLNPVIGSQVCSSFAIQRDKLYVLTQNGTPGKTIYEFQIP